MVQSNTSSASLDHIIDKHKNEKGALMPILQDINADFNYLPEEALRYVAEKLSLPLSQVLHVSTFYNVFSLEGCSGFCQKETLVDILVPGRLRITYAQVTPETAEELVATLSNGSVRADLALYNTLQSLSPEEIIDEMKRSGLSGRGGGGFLTGWKFKAVQTVGGDGAQETTIVQGHEPVPELPDISIPVTLQQDSPDTESDLHIRGGTTGGGESVHTEQRSSHVTVC